MPLSGRPTEVRLVCSGSLDFEARVMIRDAVARLLDVEIGDRKVVLDLRGVSMMILRAWAVSSPRSVCVTTRPHRGS
jgi:hypothetical protein